MADGEEESDKPKKVFEIKVTVWDDGAADADVRELIKIGTGRGAPTKCGPLNPADFAESTKRIGGLAHEEILKQIVTFLGGDPNSVKVSSTPSSANYMRQVSSTDVEAEDGLDDDEEETKE